ncbi:LacI family DNA-binding transcriptional regulator [Micropruina sonneratiae]|uniref:LacI family DNA-binding transcriptional regulator n=1 Tax=Micropruina sonneratiae TaxID=2986940 RepID=UPI00222680FE|nr:substrate-binding domain-containing protein [Micropruina sp. KQZ13P-5]MCW3159375.1 substrate-binding domain-containing protein [Micropruina sp. KQZ13P-5]
MPRVTMKDVAQAVGVSVMTVSNAFNRPDQLSTPLRERILQRASAMGYGGPNAAARHLRAGRTHCYGVVLSESLGYAFNDPYSVLWLAGFSEPLQAAGATMTLLPVPRAPGSDRDVIRRASVDGLAGFCATHAALEAARSCGIPMVLAHTEDADSDWVAIDDFAAGTQLGAHLRRLGHRDVVLLADRAFTAPPGPLDVDGEPFRLALHALARAGLFDIAIRIRGLLHGLGPDCRVRFVGAGANSRDAGRLASGHALEAAERPTAICCISDVLALGVLDALADDGLVPGRDVTVTGFDDLPEAGRSGLTTIRQPIRDKGRLAGELLLDPERTPRQLTLPHQLVVRTSSGPNLT